MARIAGIELQDSWRVDYALTRIKGLGWSLARRVLKLAKVPGTKRISELSSEEIAKISTKLEGIPTEGELARRVKTNISRLVAIGSYRGSRHSRNLPVRGQRTRTNARTKRGKRKTVGAFKKEILTAAKTAQTEEAKK